MKKHAFTKALCSFLIGWVLVTILTVDAEAQRRRRRSYYSSAEMMYSVGAVGIFPRYTDDLFKNFSEEYFGVTFSPRLNLMMGREQSLSMALYLSLLTGKYPDEEGNEQNLAYELPFVVNFNFGAGATHDASNPLGGFFGLGYQFSNLNLIDPRESTIDLDPNSPTGLRISNLKQLEGFYFNGGLRFFLGSGTGNIHLFLVSTGIKDLRTFGVRFMYTFGNGSSYRR